MGVDPSGMADLEWWQAFWAQVAGWSTGSAGATVPIDGGYDPFAAIDTGNPGSDMLYALPPWTPPGGGGGGGTAGKSNQPQTPKPKVTCPMAASGVYRQNRWIHGNTPLSNGNPLSHTFVFTTNGLGQVANTYSWGNNGFNGAWVQNSPEDINAANQALGGNLVLNRVGGSEMLNNIQWSFDVLRGISSEVHDNGGVTSNCKTEADQLISMSK